MLKLPNGDSSPCRNFPRAPAWGRGGGGLRLAKLDCMSPSLLENEKVVKNMGFGIARLVVYFIFLQE
jgi:hypothetical protein